MAGSGLWNGRTRHVRPDPAHPAPVPPVLYRLSTDLADSVCQISGHTACTSHYAGTRPSHFEPDSLYCAYG